MPVECVGVVGAGVMGSEIAQVAAAGGLDVLLSDVDQERVDRGVAHVRDICARRVKRGRMSQEDADALVARVHPVVGLEGLAPADLAIEAVTEVMEVKRKVFSTLDGVLGPDALIASNTSGLSITELGEVTSRPAQVLGLHFFNPASVMRLVEVIRGEHTGEATLAAGRDLAVSLGKTPVLVRECPGFLVNRILVRAMVESYRRAAETGAGAAAADAAVVAGGPAPMGPFALGDLIGLDTMDHIQGDLERAYGDRFADGGVLAGLVAQGRLGQKSGGGFFDGAAPEAEADAAGRDVAERYYMSALEEACRCLAEGIAELPDIDTAMRLGAGWSQGPLAWADEVGLQAAAARMAALVPEAGARYEVPAVLAERAAGGGRFTPAS